MFFTLCLLSSRMAAALHNDTGTAIGSESAKNPQSLVHRNHQHKPISSLPSSLLVPILCLRSSYIAQDQITTPAVHPRICNISLPNWRFKELWSQKRNPTWQEANSFFFFSYNILLHLAQTAHNSCSFTSILKGWMDLKYIILKMMTYLFQASKSIFQSWIAWNIGSFLFLKKPQYI